MISWSSVKAGSVPRHEVLLDRVGDRKIADLLRASDQTPTDLGEPGVIGEGPGPGLDADASTNDSPNSGTENTAADTSCLLDWTVMAVSDRRGKQEAGHHQRERVVSIATNYLQSFASLAHTHFSHQTLAGCFESFELVPVRSVNRVSGTHQRLCDAGD